MGNEYIVDAPGPAPPPPERALIKKEKSTKKKQPLTGVCVGKDTTF